MLSHLPPFLRGVRILRDASYPCGSARTVHLGCCAPFSGEERRKLLERGLPISSSSSSSSDGSTPKDGGVSKEEQAAKLLHDKSIESLHWKGARGGVAVVKMGHFIGAQNFAGGMLALVKCANNGGSLPPKPGPNGIVPGVATTTTTASNDADEATAEEAANGFDGEAEAKSKSSNGESPPSTDDEIQYTQEEEGLYKETLSLLKDMQVYHFFQYHIPDPIPPDMKVPQSDPTVQDAAIPYNLLESMTSLRLRYEEAVKEAASNSGSYTLSTSVSYLTDDQWGGHAAAAGGGDEDDAANAGNILKLDKDKLAAAVGGGQYDEEADPLNAPDVVKAVLAFKRRLEDQNAKGKKRRVEVINDRLGKKVKELLEEGRVERDGMRKQLEMQKKLSEERVQNEQQGMDVVAGEGGEAKNVEDTGQRGVSNLPAWMTKGDAAANGTTIDPSEANTEDDGKKPKFVSEANRDINSRKQRLNVDGGKSLSEIRAANEAADKQAAAVTPFVAQTTPEGILAAGTQFPPLSSAASEPMKQYVTAQIVDYLGEEESTLIDFIMKELGKDGGGAVAPLLEEMKVVLDEDAEDFVVGLYRKMVE